MSVCDAERKVGLDRRNHQSHPIVRTLGRLGDYPQATLPKNPDPSDCEDAVFAKLNFVPCNARLDCVLIPLAKEIGEACDHFDVVVHFQSPFVVPLITTDNIACQAQSTLIHIPFPHRLARHFPHIQLAGVVFNHP